MLFFISGVLFGMFGAVGWLLWTGHISLPHLAFWLEPNDAESMIWDIKANLRECVYYGDRLRQQGYTVEFIGKQDDVSVYIVKESKK